ncbi:histidine kinase [Membranicola marinus]|uniref:Histidine kinase n=1 Tax=Membranihabitans marinus TaxID=1227546 RepID=A0A953LAH6_9BACT|nr:sensor histidine kinase [Membranihabitans marinus]MBY5957581.1 histidine kinase [Membranihabitans marinus]
MNRLIRLIVILVYILIAEGTLYGQIDPMPSYDLFYPEYGTYRHEKELYSYNLIDYMFVDRDRKLWLSSVHDLKRSNGYQFFNISQILDKENHLKGHIIDGQRWNDSTHYIIEQNANEGLLSHALSTTPPIHIAEQDSAKSKTQKLLFYDVRFNEYAYEVWTDSLQNLLLKIVGSTGKLLRDITIPPLDGQLTAFCVAKDRVWFLIDHRKIITFLITDQNQLTDPVKIGSSGTISTFYTDQFENIWVTKRNGIYQIRIYKSQYYLALIKPLKDISKVFEDDHGNLIFTATSFPDITEAAYLYVREGGRWITMESLISQNHDLHYFAGQDFHKEIFLSAKNNLSTLRFTENSISNEIFDRQTEESRWNFISRGLFKTDSLFYVLVANQGLWSKNMNTDEEKLTTFQHPESGKTLDFDCLRTIETDADGRLWFSICNDQEGSQESFLIRYDPVTTMSKVIPYPHLISALQMGQGSLLWIASENEDGKVMLSRFNTNTTTVSAPLNIIPNISTINDLFLLEPDSMFLATNDGLYKYAIESAETKLILLRPNTHNQTTIFSIFFYDNKYFLASRDGLFIYDPASGLVDHFTMENGLRNNIVTAVFREKANKYWLSTFFGLSVLNLNENLILNYSTLDGLPNNEFNLYAYHEDPSGYYLGYPNGVLQLDLRDSMKGYFADFDLDHALTYSRKNEKATILFPENNHLDISPEVTYFKLFPSSFAGYFIDYFNFKLINTTLKDTVLFSAVDGVIQSNLKAGTYHFKLSSYDRYGNNINNEKQFSITVHEHFYQTIWFRILILLLANIIIGTMIYGWLRFRNRKKRKEKDLEKRLSELELQVLQTQLNPHFIFNTISAIQYYIQDHDEDHADQYLTSFSRLMRSYLDSSKSSYITLNTEINLLKNYLDLEIMVADDRIKSHFEIDPDIDLVNVVIPTMMLQPFVENAIQHGLFHKKGNGNITLRFIKVAEDMLLCEIEDDGIGRRKAEMINRQKPQKPTSRALQIINEKLEVLKESRGMKIEINIIDKYQNGTAKGTLVQIKIPFLLKKSHMNLVQS